MYWHLRMLLMKHGSSAQKLGKYMGVSANGTSYKIRGMTDWKLEELVKIQRFFQEKGVNCSIEELFPEAFELDNESK